MGLSHQSIASILHLAKINEENNKSRQDVETGGPVVAQMEFQKEIYPQLKETTMDMKEVDRKNFI